MIAFLTININTAGDVTKLLILQTKTPTQDGEEHQPLQKGDHVEYRTWRDHDGKMVAVRVERVKERPRSVGVGGNGNGGIAGGGGPAGQWRTDRATQAHFR